MDIKKIFVMVPTITDRLVGPSAIILSGEEGLLSATSRAVSSRDSLIQGLI